MSQKVNISLLGIQLYKKARAFLAAQETLEIHRVRHPPDLLSE
jgi:hypothetical protein